MLIMSMSVVAAAGVVVPLAAGGRRGRDDRLITVMVMGAAVDEPEVGRPRKDHGQDRHKTGETEARTLLGSVSCWPDWRHDGHLRELSQGEERLIHIHGHDYGSQGCPVRIG